MKLITAAAIAAFALGSTSASASAESWLAFEASLGYTHYQDEDGRWIQHGAPVQNEGLSAIAAGAGLTGDLWSRGAWGVSYHLDYEYMGTASASCLCTTDQNYSRGSHLFINPHGPVASFQGSGHTQGAVVSLSPWFESKGFRFALEAGAFFHWDTWNETYQHSQDLSAPSGMHIAPVAGLSISRGPFAIQWRHYFMNGSLQAESVPPLWRGIDTIQLVYTRSF